MPVAVARLRHAGYPLGSDSAGTLNRPPIDTKVSKHKTITGVAERVGFEPRAATRNT
jgi:hypothetical protein